MSGDLRETVQTEAAMIGQLQLEEGWRADNQVLEPLDLALFEVPFLTSAHASFYKRYHCMLLVVIDVLDQPIPSPTTLLRRWQRT